MAWCGIGVRSVGQARDLARRGDVAGVGAALAEAPDLLRPAYAAAIMQAAALAGRAEVVRMLLDRGAGADHPFYLPVGVTGVVFERVIFATPLCAARMKRRSAVESLLMAAGAREDVFTSAFLGDLSSLARMLAADPDLAQATDPAVDILDITAVETGNQGRKDDPEYIRALLRHGARANDRRTGDPQGTSGVRALNATALHYAAKAGFLRTIEVLIEHGADPDARDSHGRTPLDWLEQAAPSVSRAAVRNLLAPEQPR